MLGTNKKNIRKRDFQDQRNTNDAGKTVYKKVIGEQMVYSLESPTTSNNEVEPLSHKTDKSIDWKK